jgi:AGCS family alanine or glycine:cation symporter
MDWIESGLLDPLSDALYTWLLVRLLVGAGLLFTVRTGLAQV